MPKLGKVVLVGAGPGDRDLLTLRAVERIASADVIIYDRLIQPSVLATARPAAERIDVGKGPDHHTEQNKIHALLVEKAREGKMVVRLKGGDPFLFGRGGEEVEYLAEHGIPFEVVPGISSCLAAPLSAGIAVTHRESSSSLAIVTGHNAEGNGDRVDWPAVARMDTLVCLMGMHSLKQIADKLVAAGRAKCTPAAIVQMAFWEDARVVTGTLETIADDAQREGVKPPATLVVGEAVRLRQRLEQLMASNEKRKEVCV